MLLGYIRYKLHQYVGLLVFHLHLSWTLGSLSKLATLSLFYRYYFGRCSFEVVELVPLPHSCGRSTHYFHRFHYLSVTIIRCCREVYVNCFFPDTTRLWNSLHAECFPLTFDLNGFNDKWLMRMFIYFCIHFNFRFHTCFELGILWHSGNHRAWIHAEMCTWDDKNIQSNAQYSQDSLII